MFALSLETAKTAAIVIVAVFVIGSVAATLIMKTIVQKLATAAVLLLLAFSVYSQRTSLQDCADKVKGNFAREGTSVTVTDTDCSFFGTTITVKNPRNDTGPDATAAG